MPESSRFRFRKTDRVGDPSAEQDNYLESCFVDTGNLAILRSCSDSRAVIVGRTGSGKSALIRRLKDVCEHCIDIDLQLLSINYITGSTLLTYFERELGVKLDLFYQSLWRHVFVVALLKKHYDIEDESDRQKVFDYLMSQVLRNKGRIDAFRYLNNWGTQFWTTSEERIKSITTNIEKELQGSAGLELGQLATLNAGGTLTLSQQQEREVARHGQEIVNNVQMNHLSAIMDALNEDILTDAKRRYYILVDFLDEHWVGDERLRVWLIRGLIETVRDFNRKVDNAKILVSLRLDLLRRVYRATSDSGFQEEKYEALNLEVAWTRQELESLLDERVQALIRQRYTKQKVTLRDVLPTRMEGRKGGQSGVDYLLDRTLMRPRDAIQFFNACVEVAVGDAEISAARLMQAESRYSQQRRTALADEWSMFYPYLVLLTDLLKARGPQFRLGAITDRDLDGVSLQLHDAEDHSPHPYARDVEMFDRYYRSVITGAQLRALLTQCFYTVGLIGVKLSPQLGTLWSSDGGLAALNSAEICDDVIIHIHKAFWRVLGINPEASTVR